MKLIRLSTYILLTAMLIACSGNESENETVTSNEQTAQAMMKNEVVNGEASTKGETTSDIKVDEHGGVIQEAIAFAGESTAHEGTLKVYEQIDQGADRLMEQTLEINYAQNEMVGSEEEGYQLTYKKVQYNSELDGTPESAFYRQPGVADYKLYEPENFWHANDYSQIDASIEERLDFMSPFDVLTLYQLFKSEAEVIIDDEESLTLAFTLNEDEAIEYAVNEQFLEPESFLYTSEYFFAPETYTVMISFDKMEKVLQSVHVEVYLKDSDDESVTMMLQSYQTFNSYMLTGEITPPAEAFEETNLAKWDY